MTIAAPVAEQRTSYYRAGRSDYIVGSGDWHGQAPTPARPMIETFAGRVSACPSLPTFIDDGYPRQFDIRCDGRDDRKELAAGLEDCRGRTSRQSRRRCAEQCGGDGRTVVIEHKAMRAAPMTQDLPVLPLTASMMISYRRWATSLRASSADQPRGAVSSPWSGSSEYDCDGSGRRSARLAINLR